MIVDVLREQATMGGAVTTLTRYLSSLGRLHWLLGLSDPTASECVRLELKARDLDLHAPGPLSAHADAARNAERLVCDAAAIAAALTSA